MGLSVIIWKMDGYTEEQIVTTAKHWEFCVPPFPVMPRFEKGAPEQMVGQTKALVCWASVLHSPSVY